MTTTLPFTPDDEQARRLLDEQIDSYDVDPAAINWWERLLMWLNDALQLNVDPASAGNVAIYVVLAVGIALVAVLLLKYFRAAETPGTDTKPSSSLADPTVSAQQYLDQAQQHLAAGRWAPASLDAFRCLVRTAAERQLVEVTPATTATVFGWRLGAVLPDLQQVIADAAAEFNSLNYGAGVPTKHQADTMIELAQTLATAQPQTPNPQHDPTRLMPR